ncbi:MAG TPA: class I SAM-dependent methyltransferase [Solirubrobacteraceae bacterium]
MTGSARLIPPPTPPVVVWHDLECGAYSADLPLWHELAQRSGDSVLDIGAGSGRVTLELARSGHAVTALDCEPLLLDALRDRGRTLGVRTVCADARSFSLERTDYDLCVVPMQTIQLLGGVAGRADLLRCAKAHLRPGGVLACAILGEIEPFDCSAGGNGPAAERASVDGLLYLSRAVRVSETPTTVVIERERRVLSDGARIGPTETSPKNDDRLERNIVELDRVGVRQLQHEGEAAGLSVAPTHNIAATDEHVSSSVVMFCA